MKASKKTRLFRRKRGHPARAQGRKKPSKTASPGTGRLPITRLVPVRSLNPYPRVRLLAKLECDNPSGSLKDRIAWRMVEYAERTGRLKPGQTLIEPTSGNMGIALAMVGALKGYPVVAVVSPLIGWRKRKMLEQSGARIIFSAPGRTDAAVDHAKRLAAAEPQRYCLLNQYADPQSVMAHYEGTGREIWKQAGGKVDGLVAPLGTGSTLMGAGRFLRERNPKVKVVAVAPPPGGHIEGLRDLSRDRTSEIYDSRQVDWTEYVSPSVSQSLALKLRQEEGLDVGLSSGASFYGALRLAERLKKGTVVFICPDRANRYE